jgi:hypothetical protein
MGEGRIGRYMEGDDCGLSEVHVQNLAGGMREKCGKFKSGLTMLNPKF